MSRFEYEVAKSGWISEDERRLFGWEYDGESIEEGPLVAYHVGGSTDTGGSSIWGGTTTYRRKRKHHGTRWRRDLAHPRAIELARLWQAFLSNAPRGRPVLVSRLIAGLTCAALVGALVAGLLVILNSAYTLEPYLGEWSGILWWMSIPVVLLLVMLVTRFFGLLERLLQGLDGNRRTSWEGEEDFRRRQREIAKAEARRITA